MYAMLKLIVVTIVGAIFAERIFAAIVLVMTRIQLEIIAFIIAKIAGI
jgi:hypothetical protein